MSASWQELRQNVWCRGALACAAASALVFLLPAAQAGAPTTAAAELTHEQREGLIFERQQIMTRMEDEAELIGNIAAGLAPADKLAEATRAVAVSAKEARASFVDVIPGGRSKPEVWSNSADFKQRMDQFVANTEKLAAAGKTGNVTAVTELLIDALPCKQCHDVYREPKKSAPPAPPASK